MNLLSRIYEKSLPEEQQPPVVVLKEVVAEEKKDKKDVVASDPVKSLPAGSLKIVKGLHKS